MKHGTQYTTAHDIGPQKRVSHHKHDAYLECPYL